MNEFVCIYFTEFQLKNKIFMLSMHLNNTHYYTYIYKNLFKERLKLLHNKTDV